MLQLHDVLAVLYEVLLLQLGAGGLPVGQLRSGLVARRGVLAVSSEGLGHVLGDRVCPWHPGRALLEQVCLVRGDSVLQVDVLKVLHSVSPQRHLCSPLIRQQLLLLPFLFGLVRLAGDAQ